MLNDYDSTNFGASGKYRTSGYNRTSLTTKEADPIDEADSNEEKQSEASDAKKQGGVKLEIGGGPSLADAFREKKQKLAEERKE